MTTGFLTEKNKPVVFAFLFFSLILVCIPRFDRADYGFIKNFTGKEELYEGLPYDILIYKNYIGFFRSENYSEQVMPPYTYRILIPFLASKLPFDPLTSLNLLNLFFLQLGLIALFLTLKKLNLNFQLCVIGCMMYIFSFPVFYYATSGYIDGSLIGLISIGVYLIVSEKFFWLMLLILIGALANEKIIILFPFLISFIITKKFTTKKIIEIILCSGVIYFITTIILRKFTISNSHQYIWFPGTDFILQNIYRPKTYLSFILTFGIPGLLAVVSFLKFSKETIRKYLYFYAGCVTSIALYIYSIFAAWSDGRTVWTIYPFAIPVSILYIRGLLKK